jgi:hypothetical protein
MKTPQWKTVLLYLQSGKGITQIEATYFWNICCLAERIRDLKKRGITIRPDKEPHKGGYHVRYFLAP